MAELTAKSTAKSIALASRRQMAWQAAEDCSALLVNQFQARRVILFGSLAGHSPWHEKSDIDLAVEGLPEGSLFTAYGACRELIPPSLALDLVPLEMATPELRARILGKRVEMGNTPLLALRALIEDELTGLDRLVALTQEALETVDDPPSPLILNGLAAYLHQFYTGIESIFRRIALQIDGSVPGGEQSHLNLLNQMAQAQPGRRPALLTDQQRLILRDYLQFRHFFRHAYGYQLRWAELQLKLVAMPTTLALLRQQLHPLWEQLVNGGEANGDDER
jgi:predicted nucleotidyltransferase